jgi:hypothetical protein
VPLFAKAARLSDLAPTMLELIWLTRAAADERKNADQSLIFA